MVHLTSFAPPTEGVRQQQPDTAAIVGGNDLGPGTLYVAESRLSWFDKAGMGFSLEYPSISLHAISRDLHSYPREHLYVMVNGSLTEQPDETAMAEEDEEEEEESDEDSESITEIRFVPSDNAALQPLFSAMCDCQALHPDPDDEDSEEDFEDEYDVEANEQGQGDIPTFYTYEEGFSHLTIEGQATLERLEGMLAQSANQFQMAGVRTDSSGRDNEDMTEDSFLVKMSA
ncbi:methylosome subunit pICln isoform X2 [Protopterus annectens]|uniref:methylosome subunit pICln isoform X2 n=1 Tax=Protopterus annectens TaxID=7888 RepID=UPI001CFAC1C2|nr:methylosome subunit pICln isoform X2 [Protopterus annectens]